MVPSTISLFLITINFLDRSASVSTLDSSRSTPNFSRPFISVLQKPSDRSIRCDDELVLSWCWLQIRRSSYHDVIRVSEIQKVLDLTGVQTYIINSARVVFLNERPQPRPRKGVTNNCEVCGRSLLDSFRFCSLGCKMAGTAPDRKRKNKILHEAMKIKSTTESDTDESYTSISRGSEKSNVTHSVIPSTPPPTAASLSSAKRRKGIPHRAPFGSLTLEF
ncbi:PLATZ transcription factor [Musa troglodytarum]|uniref:PLATZ transcription factor n=1 Tax=Musa troglodytarum TaxID=320322 RepID=A0A9E7FPP0_9LILI|nr:PLATZ transcription factor [Musa troglodytarum]